MKSDQSRSGLFRWFVFSLLLAGSTSLLADNVDVNFSGFASLVYAKALGGGEGPFNNITDEGEYRDFNTLGLRMDAELHDRVSFAAQMVSYGIENYEPEFDWIFVSLDLTPELRLDVGKSRIPMYMYSDFIDVGYAYQWVKPPSTVYVAGRSYFQSVEGLKFNYVTSIGAWESELLFFGGKAEEHFTSLDGTEQVDLYIENLSGAAWTLEYDWLTLRAVYSQGDLTIAGYSSYDELLSSISALGAGINYAENVGPVDISDFEDMVALRRDTMRFSGMGAGIDFDRVFAVLEITQSVFDENIASNDSAGGYLTAGVRLPGRITLSVTHGERRQKANKSFMKEYEALFSDYETQLPLTTSSTDPTVQALVGTATEFLDGDGIYDMDAIIRNAVNVAQDKSIREDSIQLRWDFHRSAAFKFEYLRQDNDQYSPTTYLAEKVKPEAFRIGIDVVF